MIQERKKSWHQQVKELTQIANKQAEYISILKSKIYWDDLILQKTKGQRDFFKKYSQRVCDEPRELDEK